MLNEILSAEELSVFTKYVEQSQRVVVTCHVSPDGDAMGAMLAMQSYLRRKGKDVKAIVPNIFPDFLKWMPFADQVYVYEKHETELEPELLEADLIVCLDFNASNRLLTMQQTFDASQAVKIVIDHHLDPVMPCQLLVSHPQMCSTCEVLYRIIEQEENGIEAMTSDEAVCLYTGMMTDTGCFSYASNRSDIYYIISRLLTKGFDKDKIYRNVFYSYSADRFKLMGYLLYVKMQVFHEYHASLMTLTRREQKQFSHKKGDTEGFVNIPLQINKSRLSIFLREDTERPVIRVSLRSVDDFPCNKIAEEFFHGGGHLNASGGELSCSMEEAEQIVKDALKKYVHLLKE